MGKLIRGSEKYVDGLERRSDLSGVTSVGIACLPPEDKMLGVCCPSSGTYGPINVEQINVYPLQDGLHPGLRRGPRPPAYWQWVRWLRRP